MELHNLHPAKNYKKDSKRIGRGHGSGHGKTSGRGSKGQKARSGGSIRRGFEGGQMPLQRRVPKRGFVNIFAKKVVAVNVKKLEIFGSGEVVGVDELKKFGIVKGRFDKLKIIGDGDLTKKLIVKANKFSKTAIEKIEAVGGKAEVI